MNLKSKLTGIVITLVLVAGSSIFAQNGIDPGVADTIIVDSSVAFIGGRGVVPVNIWFDEPLQLIGVTLRHQAAQVKIDSFSVIGGILDTVGIGVNVKINNDSNIVSFATLISGGFLMPRSGLLGNIYFSYPQSAGVQLIPIDTFRWTTPNHIELSTELRDSTINGQTYLPQFKMGYLDIHDTPATFDSVWVNDINAGPGEKFVISVSGYNERNLSEITLALDWGTSRLAFDSLSWDGTRSEIATNKVGGRFSSTNKFTATIKFAPGFPLATGSGTLANLFFSVDSTTPDTSIIIDTTTILPVTTTKFVLTTLDGGLTIHPLIYNSGLVSILGTTGIEDITDDKPLPDSYTLGQNYPNPFNPTTNIEFSLPASEKVKIDIFNILGRRVRSLVDQYLPAGYHRVTFNGRNRSGKLLASGVYLYRIQVGDFIESRKMMLLK